MGMACFVSKGDGAGCGKDFAFPVSSVIYYCTNMSYIPITMFLTKRKRNPVNVRKWARLIHCKYAQSPVFIKHPTCPPIAPYAALCHQFNRPTICHFISSVEVYDHHHLVSGLLSPQLLAAP